MNVDNSNMELDPDVAKRLFAEGAILIIAGVPIGTQFGIDLCSYTIGEKFRGVKMVPPGPHLIYCESQGPYGDSAPRVGFVHYFHPNEIIVREWDNQNEELRERRIADPELEKRRIRENLLELDEFLAPYDYRFAGDWKHLIDTVSEETVNRCRPALGTIRTNVELQSCPDSERPRGVPGVSPKVTKITSEDELLPNLKPIEGTGPRFTDLPGRVPKDAKTPTEITKHHMDCCQAIDDLITSFDSPERLIEEVQLAFVMFLIGYSIESLAHWRKILNLLANSETAVQKFKIFYMKYSEVLQYELPNLPEELMEPSEHNTVFKDIRNLLINMSIGGLSVSAERLRKNLEKTMIWEFVGLLDDDPEDLPVVVET